ncbi:MAG: transcription antitermination factor NusB [Paracoccaceae bacterium]
MARRDRALRSAARLAAVQALFQMEAAGADWREVRDEFEAHRIGAEGEGGLPEADLELFRLILEGAVSRQAQIDQAADAAMKEGWPMKRLDPTLRALFRAAGAELFDGDVTPPKVVISEFVDVAKAFFADGKEPGLVNAVLDKMARAARPGAFA